MNRIEQAEEDEENLEDLKKFLSQSGKITEIIDIEKEEKIMLTRLGMVLSYFLLIAGIVILSFWSYCTYNSLFVNYDKYTDVGVTIGCFIGMLIDSLIIIGVSIHTKNKSRLKITYLNEKQMKINNRVYDIDKESCYINIYQRMETYTNDNGVTHSYLVYVLGISTLTRKIEYRLWPETKKRGLLEIPDRTDIEGIIEFVNNFKYDSEIPKLKIKQNMMDAIYNRVINKE